MRPRHPRPSVWLITDPRMGAELLPAIGRMPRGSGVLFRHHELPTRDRRALLRQVRRVAGSRRIVVVDDQAGSVARVHSARELRRALLERAELIFLSPVFATRSHPDWQPLGRMRAAALLRLAGRPMLALGGMDARRFAEVRALGFMGWGGIDAWVRAKRSSREQIP